MKHSESISKPLIIFIVSALLFSCQPDTVTETDEDVVSLVSPPLPTKLTNGSDARPNIVFIFSDDHSYEAVSAYGGRLSKVAPTPNLDRIASEGIRFDNCFVTNALCGPSRAVIQTGKHSHLNGFMENEHRFDGSQQTFPKLLQKGGL